MPAVFTYTMHREKRKSGFLSETCEIFVDLWGLGDKIYTYRWGATGSHAVPFWGHAPLPAIIWTVSGPFLVRSKAVPRHGRLAGRFFLRIV